MKSNPELILAQQFIEQTGTSLFLTGKAGTGKTTFLRNLCLYSPKRMVVVAPTGVAAINAGGMTIHSFFQLPFGPYLPDMERIHRDPKERNRHKISKEKIDIMRSLDLLVIDEISMVRADVLDAISETLCRYRNPNLPFGGVQLLMIGDLQQLSPIAREEEWELLKQHYESPYFFHSRALQRTYYLSLELKTVYRQSNVEFVEILNGVRERRLTQAQLDYLNQRYLPDFAPKDEEGYIVLTTHNNSARTMNEQRLNALSGKPYVFEAEIADNFPEMNFPTDRLLILKEGAQVMFVKNDSSPEKRYFNGKIGRILRIDDEMIEVLCSDSSTPIIVDRETWENVKYTLNHETKEITETIDGTFKQFPLKTAWAITIHKSQGLTFERAIIDANYSFAHGQVYVALSRCKSLEGLVLRTPLRMSSIINDSEVRLFTRHLEENQPGEQQLNQAQRAYFAELLRGLFDFHLLHAHLRSLQKTVAIYGGKLYPQLLDRWNEKMSRFVELISSVSEKFISQLNQLVATHDDFETQPYIQERIAKASDYFTTKLTEEYDTLIRESKIDLDNQEGKKQLIQDLDKCWREYNTKLTIMAYAKGGFEIKSYLEVRAKALLESPKFQQINESDAGAAASDEILDAELYSELRRWRAERASEIGMPAYVVLSQKGLINLVNHPVLTPRELSKIKGIGPAFMARYGKEVIEILYNYKKKQGVMLDLDFGSLDDTISEFLAETIKKPRIRIVKKGQE